MDPGRIANLFVPSRCPVCRQGVDPDSLLCGECMRELNRSRVLRADPPEGVDRITSFADHEGIPRHLLAAFKFRHLTGLVGLIAGFMTDAAGLPDEHGLLVPVPPARLRTRMRGFDPVGLLADEISALIDLPRPGEAVLRRRGSGRQRGRGRTGRLANPPDIRPSDDAGRIIGGREILLVDDVMTTGATLSTAAGALRHAGAASVVALTFTRRL
ncbi:MAG: ComF family protein [Solirubrobacterales bacterium]|nr:ComF family protein [Solirubrobacterales bacterium]